MSIVENMPEEDKSGRIRRVRTTVTKSIFGRPVSETTTTQEIVYVDENAEELKKKIRQAVKKAQSIPPELRKHAESLISEIYADAKDHWNPNSVGDIEGVVDRASYRPETGESMFSLGKVLAARGIKPEKILLLAKESFCTPEGKNNESLNQFLLDDIKLRMGLRDEKTS